LIPPEEVAKIKARAKANLINGLNSNEGLALQLASYATAYGDWHRLFHEMERVETITAQDINRVANRYLIPNNQTVGLLEPEEK
ncbi:MAG: insulinase family protein, partial [candidate division Zixibacteria bacterium]|nr:insulinase family protein [candidate division Zixibacteria bacterium]